MTTDKAQSGSAGGNRQKIILGVVVVVFAFLAYQIYGMFSGGSSTPAPQPVASPAQQQAMQTPQPAQLLQSGTQTASVSEREMALMKLQQETQAKYLEALNELQMLKVQKDIAETNKDIAAAKLETVTAQKGVVDLLQPQQTQPTNPNYAAGLVNPTGAEAASSVQPVAQQPKDTYTVVSVTHLQGRWNAVLGSGGKLISVYVGDTLPNDNAKVVAIDKSGVTLKMDDGTTKKVPMVSII